MATKQIIAKEMHTAEVERISLVKHAASRIPIRVTKEDHSMSKSILDRSLDIANVFKGSKPKAEAPAVVGVAVMKSDKPQTVLMSAIEEAGFAAAAAVDMGDGSQVFPQGDVSDFTGATVLKFEGNAALVLKGFSPYSLDMEVENGASFDEMCRARGFYPGISSMMDVLRDVVIEHARNASDPSAAAKTISGLFTEAGKYAASLVGALPSKAFKLETIDPEDEVAGGGDPATGDVTKDPAITADASAAPAVVAKAEPEAAPAVTVVVDPAAVVADPTDATATAATAPAAVAKAEPDATPAVLALPANVMAALEAVGTIAQKMDTLTATVGKVAESQTAQAETLSTLAGRVESAEKVAKAANEAVSGTVVVSGAGEAGDRQTAVKQEKPQYGDTDSAYAPRRPRR